MKTMFAPGARHTRAFTLLELLVVITIIAILGSLAAGQVIKAIEQANRLKTQTLANELKNGIDAYLTDYNHFPIDTNTQAANGEDIPEILTDGSNPLVEALMGIPPAPGATDLNPKRTPFAPFTPGNKDRHGIAGTARPYRLNDMWGQPFHIRLDTNGDNQVKNPDATNADPKISQNQPSHLAARVIVYSSGKDMTPQTADDVASWRQK